MERKVTVDNPGKEKQNFEAALFSVHDYAR